MPSIFTKIIQGEIPCYKIYEDKHTIAFLAKDQITRGHALVVPKVEVDEFIDLEEPYYSAVFQNAKKIAKAIKKAMNCNRIMLVIAGWEVPHCHYHLIPSNSMADLDFSKARVLLDDDMKEIQEKIVSSLM